jgi:hypothetical protein
VNWVVVRASIGFGKEDLNAKVTKDEKSPFITFTKFRDDMIARQIHDLPVPDHFDNEFKS